MTVIDLTRSALVPSLFVCLFVLLLFLPAIGSTQESAQDEGSSALTDSADAESTAGSANANDFSVNEPAAASDDSKKPVAEFKVSPNRCVTLRQGQPCFVRIRFEWQSDEVVKACVYGVEGKELRCWQASSEGSAYIAQTLPNTTEFVLLNDEGVELNRASVSVAWVYKKKRSKRRWRLF